MHKMFTSSAPWKRTRDGTNTNYWGKIIMMSSIASGRCRCIARRVVRFYNYYCAAFKPAAIKNRQINSDWNAFLYRIIGWPVVLMFYFRVFTVYSCSRCTHSLFTYARTQKTNAMHTQICHLHYRPKARRSTAKPLYFVQKLIKLILNYIFLNFRFIMVQVFILWPNKINVCK